MNARPTRRAKFIQIWLAGLFVLSLLLGSVQPAAANRGNPPAARTFLTLVAPAEKNLGERFLLMGVLKDNQGRPITGKSITFNLDGEYLGQARTNEAGYALYKVKKDISAGRYVLSASFKGAHLLKPNITTAILSIRPAVVYLKTIPPVEGVTFRMDGRRAVSGPDGMAQILMYKAGIFRLDVEMDRYSSEDQRVEFGRWGVESYEPFSEVRVPSDSVIEVGLDIFHQVGLNFQDLDGLSVDPKRISSITIKSIQGDLFTLTNGEPRWLPASRVSRRMIGLEETKLLYSVLNVTVDGSNVVNQAQQRFYTQPNDTWPITLLLYSIKISAKDAMFGSPVGKTVEIKFPDDRVETYTLNADGQVEIHSLARGIYEVQVLGASGMSNRIPVALSRNQEMNIKVITTLDMVVLGSLMASLALGLLLFGRPWLLTWVIRRGQRVVSRSRPAQRQPEWVSIHDN